MDNSGVSNVRNAGVILAVITVITFIFSLLVMAANVSSIPLVLVSLALRVGLVVLIFYGLKRVTDHFEEKWGTVFMIVAFLLIIFTVITFDGSFIITGAHIVAYVYLIIGGNQIRNLN